MVNFEEIRKASKKLISTAYNNYVNKIEISLDYDVKEFWIFIKLQKI